MAVASDKLGVAKRFSAVWLQVVQNEGFVRLFESFSNVDCLGALAIGPAAPQVRRTIDMVVVWIGKDEIVAHGRFERRSIFCFVGLQIGSDEFG